MQDGNVEPIWRSIRDSPSVPPFSARSFLFYSERKTTQRSSKCAFTPTHWEIAARKSRSIKPPRRFRSSFTTESRSLPFIWFVSKDRLTVEKVRGCDHALPENGFHLLRVLREVQSRGNQSRLWRNFRFALQLEGGLQVLPSGRRMLFQSLQVGRFDGLKCFDWDLRRAFWIFCSIRWRKSWTFRAAIRLMPRIQCPVSISMPFSWNRRYFSACCSIQVLSRSLQFEENLSLLEPLYDAPITSTHYHFETFLFHLARAYYQLALDLFFFLLFSNSF